METDDAKKVDQPVASEVDTKIEEMWKPSRVCAFFSISQVTFYRWQKSGMIKTIKVGGRFHRVPVSEIRRLLNEQKKKILQA